MGLKLCRRAEIPMGIITTFLLCRNSSGVPSGDYLGSHNSKRAVEEITTLEF